MSVKIIIFFATSGVFANTHQQGYNLNLTGARLGKASVIGCNFNDVLVPTVTAPIVRNENEK